LAVRRKAKAKIIYRQFLMRKSLGPGKTNYFTMLINLILFQVNILLL